MSAAREDLILKYAMACKRNATEMAGMPITVICQHFREFADELACLSTDPGEAEKKRAPVDYYKVLKRFAEEDGSIREGRLTALSFALAAAPLPEESRHGR